MGELLVPLTPHADSERLARAMERCLPLAVSWKGTIFRSTSPEYANETDLVSGVGSKIEGARYTPKDEFAAVYGSLDPDTAMAEALAFHRNYGVPDEQAMPLVFVAVRADLLRVLNLTDRKVRARLRVTRRDLINEPWREEQYEGREHSRRP